MTSNRTSPTTTTPTVARPSAQSRRATRWILASLSVKSRWIACAAVWAPFVACSGAAATPPGPPRFAERIAPLAAERCDGCHARRPGGPMAVYGNAKSFIKPGKPDESLYLTLPRRHPAAWGDAAGVVRAWIEAGAPE